MYYHKYGSLKHHKMSQLCESEVKVGMAAVFAQGAHKMESKVSATCAALKRLWERSAFKLTQLVGQFDSLWL